jgi:hypothetical protein
MAGASTWPGGGTNATSGYLAAKEMIKAAYKTTKLVGAVAAARGGLLLGGYLLNHVSDR